MEINILNFYKHWFWTSN